MGKFTDKVVVVTGAGRGIGQAIAERFAVDGGKVALLSRTESSFKAAEEINLKHADAACGYSVDVADFTAMTDLGKQIVTEFGKVDILVNNAGVTRDRLCLRMSEEDWDTVLDTNLKGAFNAVKAFQRVLLKSGNGSVINVSSVIGLMGNAGQVNYAASKAGLIGMTKSLAKEFAGRGIRANAVCPGFISTDMTGALSDEQRDQIQEMIPLGRLGVVEDIANACAFLASDEASYITGQSLVVDGGMVM